ncbi:MAG: hypothetical protein IPQ26_06255 [Elusimicrobia bacterium]|nr:hypothetical protein [Elusimicrobiota bacterium]
MKFKISFGVFTFALAAFCAAGEPRHFLMGTTPIHISSVSFPFWTFADTQDQDLISIHGDDFLGVPWDQFANNKPLPAPWAQQWATIAKNARDTGKVRYLALSPLGGRKTLTKNVTAAGTYDETWAPVDADGCYPFSTDVNADTHRRAYGLRQLPDRFGSAPLLQSRDRDGHSIFQLPGAKTPLSPGTARCIGRSKPGTRR